jgi:hypothetical protein
MKGKTKFGLVTFFVLAMSIGCAPTKVQQEDTTLTLLPRPDLILVYDFAVSPDEVKLDTGLSAELKQKYEEHKGTSRTAQGMKEVDTLRGTAKNGRKPGMGEMMGVGAIAGHLLTSTVVSGALAGGTEMTSATVEGDGKRLAENIAQDPGKFFVGQDWIPPEAVKKSRF